MPTLPPGSYTFTVVNTPTAKSGTVHGVLALADADKTAVGTVIPIRIDASIDNGVTWRTVGSVTWRSYGPGGRAFTMGGVTVQNRDPNLSVRIPLGALVRIHVDVPVTVSGTASATVVLD